MIDINVKNGNEKILVAGRIDDILPELVGAIIRIFFEAIPDDIRDSNFKAFVATLEDIYNSPDEYLKTDTKQGV